MPRIPVTDPRHQHYYGAGSQCHAAEDGDCIWKDCPQNRDGEPYKTGRHCPIDNPDDEIF